MADNNRAGEGTGASGPEAAATRVRREIVRLPSAFIALTAGGMTAAFVATRASDGGAVASLLGMACAGGIALVACLALAEMRSTAPFCGGTWHFGRMLYGVQGGFLLAWLEVLAMLSTTALFIRAFLAAKTRCSELAGDVSGMDLVQSGGIALLLGSLVSAGLLAWMSLTPATLRKRSLPWRRVLKWFSFVALTLGWGIFLVFCWHFSFVRFTFLSMPEQGRFAEYFFDGLLLSLACFLSIIHSVPGDASPPKPGQLDDNTLGEHRRYRLPRGMILGLMVALLTAVATGLAFASVPVPDDDIGGIIHAALQVWLAFAAGTAALGGAIFGIARGVRISSALAREGMLPPWLGRVRKKDSRWITKSHYAIAGGACLVLVLVLLQVSLELWQAALTAGLLHAALGAATCFCQVRLRREAGGEVDYGFVLPGFPWITVAGGGALLGVALLCGIAFPASMLVGAATLASGLLVHEFYARSHSLQRTEDDIQELLDEGMQDVDANPMPRQALRVLVAASDVPLAVSLLEMARRLCGKRATHLNALHVLTIPDTTRLSEAARNVGQAAEFAKSVTARFAERGVSVGTSVRCFRSAARGILTTVRESRTDLLLLGWHGRIHRAQPLAWGRTIDPVLRRAPCNVVIVKGIEEDMPYRRILVPILDETHTAFALNVASRLADDHDDVEIEVFAVHALGVDDFDAREFLRKHARRVARSSVHISCRTDVYGSVVEGVLEEVLRGVFDLVVLGAPTPEQARSDEGTAVATLIAARTKVPCVMVSAAPPWLLWRNRWFRADQEKLDHL